MKPYTDIEQSRLNTMTQEEKAKAYDEAIKKAKEYWDVDIDNTMNVRAKGTMEYLFPELKENEDERIRKWLMEMVEELRKANPTNADHNGMCSESLAWLENQGELVNSLSKGLDNAHERIDELIQKNNSLMGQLEKKQGEHNSAWSEEDEGMLQSILDEYKSMLKEKRNWLKSLKDRVQPQIIAGDNQCK